MHPMAAISAALAGVFGVAIVALILSQQGQASASVISSGGTALTNVIKAAVSPVTMGTGALGSPLLANSSGNDVTNELYGTYVT